MKITINIILDILADFPVKKYLSPSEEFAFERIEFLSHNIDALSADVLYISELPKIKALSEKMSDGVCIICTASESDAEAVFLSLGCNLLVLPEHMDIFSIANLLLNSFLRLNAWENELKGAILASKTMQSLAELGSKIFGKNPIILCSPTYNLVGRSMTETTYSEKLNEILSRGYFIKEEADEVSHMGYQAHRDDYREGVLVEPPTYFGCPFFLISFPARLKTVSFMTVYFVENDPTPGLLDIFRIFASHVRMYCENIENVGTPIPSALELFMDDLLTHTYDDEMFLLDRARQLKLPPNETYRLGLVQWEEYSRDQADYVLWRLRYGLDFQVYRVMRYHDSVLMIFKGKYSKVYIDQRFNDAIDFSDFLSVCGGRVGFSTEVDSLLKLNVAYKQALAALKYGRRLAADKQFYFYSSFYIYDMIESYADKFKPEDMYVQKLKLLDNSSEGRYNNFHLLRHYLLSERSLSVTARHLHLHRNSVIYRLGKIEENLGVDLDDPDTRLRLLISFKIIEYLNGQLLPAPEKAEDSYS